MSDIQTTNSRPNATVNGHQSDPVRLYLDSLDRVTARYDEAELTVRVARAENALAEAVLRTSPGLRSVLGLLERVGQGALPFEQVLGAGTRITQDDLPRYSELLDELYDRQRMLQTNQVSENHAPPQVLSCRREALETMLRLGLPSDTLRGVVRDFRSYCRDRGVGKAWTERPPLRMSDDEVRQALEAIARAEADVTEARLTLVQANLRLVVSIARRYARNGVQLLDLVQEGNLGLMRAAQKFDYDKGREFGRYGAWWIRQAIGRALAFQRHPLRVPSQLLESTFKLGRVARQLSQSLGREPTLDELARELKLPPDKVRRVMEVPEPTLSLDATLGVNTTLLDILEDDSVPLPLEASAAVDLSERTREALSMLTALERSVLCMRFGIGREGELTLDEVGREMGMRGERVRQLEARALGKLRRCRHAEHLKSLLQP